ncbi:DUF1294 domain-containing protein [Acidovorax kalamii]|uniref:DNA-binding protein n=1 Tax=Acidovorax kalamii TaxID=2004485 RepID=A0A235ES22_9BURK|nr:cold shock and DUF1294 domain-containing protein [Acidovorax kalamii]OYD51846.1 DNA-binding protein [Acidovorax kalamii]
MQKQGTVIRWDATRAFGFIRSPDTSADVFFHVRDYRGSAAPREGLAVVYEEIHVGGKGPRAMAVQPAAQAGRATRPAASASATALPRKIQHTRPPAPSPAPRSERPAKTQPGANAPALPTLLLMLGWAALLGWGVWASRLPLWSLGAAVAINLLTFVTYAMDKSAAQSGRWRTPEKHLHLLSLAGGWPSAWCAQQWLRHKSSKQEFRTVYWTTVVVHCAALAAWVGGWLR